MRTYTREQALIIELDNPSELATLAKATGSSIEQRFKQFGCKSGFLGGEGYSEAIRKARDGDNNLVPAAQALLDSFGLDVETTMRRSQWDLVGAPIVPAAMAGFPLSMRRKVPVEDQSAPLTIAISTTSSAGISPEELALRGTACLALVMKLCETRPVNMLMFQEANNTKQSLKATHLITHIETKPLSLAHACYALTSQSYTRGLGMGYTFSQGDTGHWPDDYHSQGYADKLRARLGLSGRDVIIGGWHLNEHRDPHQWVKDKLAEIEASFSAEQ